MLGNEILEVFRNHNLIMFNQNDNVLQYNPTFGIQNYNVFFYFKQNRILKIYIIGYNQQMNMPILDFNNPEEYYYQSVQQLSKILDNICSLY